jgi:MFS family permease
MNKINWNNKFLLLDALFEGGRMFVGATSMAYLLSRNLPLSAIATLKTIQSIVLILGELPTGVICDTFGRKFGLLCSLVCGLIGFYLYFLGTNLIVFGLAEILVALSLCFWSGAYEAFCIDGLVIHDDSHLINKFFHMNSSIDKVATILFGYLGGVIALKGYQFPYLAAFFAYLIAACWLLFFFKSDQVEKHEAKSIKYHFAENFRSTFKEGILNPLLMNFFIFQILIQIVIQPLLHYWQWTLV